MAQRSSTTKATRMLTITTIGYEAASMDDFLSTLEAYCVDVLIDVRELPLSCRKGFF